ncbi:PAAR domain-containing protein [Paraburkholderia lycopersici]|uniref:PAAR motif-containing protein n=1 Tax=Paraburkholderia lycopersici TaxID=416944 RepID=A0A1G6JWZ1_9BURK|nr:PAAR domain-containing protein [Paraburkholderia lycopersici]SDC23299.1 PAAR motif-containing protein [Paraburkholderia lycopersici]
MMRRIAVVGDTLERGGEVLPYRGPVLTWGDAGHQSARIGGQAFCAQCKSTGVIAKAGGPSRLNFEMGEVALDGDIVLCKCPAPPRIVAKLSGESWCEDDTQGLGTVASSRTVGGVASVLVGPFDEQVKATGRGASDSYPYYIETADGRIESGRLGASGVLPRIHTDNADTYTIHWGEEALAHEDWK